MDSEKTQAPLTISVPEAGRRLGIGRSSAYTAAAVGQIPTIRIGGLIRVPVRALEQMLESAGAEASENAA
jgi:excisionase family DNA binding protein